eukprot:Rmarinus@m.17693
MLRNSDYVLFSASERLYRNAREHDRAREELVKRGLQSKESAETADLRPTFVASPNSTRILEESLGHVDFLRRSESFRKYKEEKLESLRKKNEEDIEALRTANTRTVPRSDVSRSIQNLYAWNHHKHSKIEQARKEKDAGALPTSPRICPGTKQMTRHRGGTTVGERLYKIAQIRRSKEVESKKKEQAELEKEAARISATRRRKFLVEPEPPRVAKVAVAKQQKQKEEKLRQAEEEIATYIRTHKKMERRNLFNGQIRRPTGEVAVFEAASLGSPVSLRGGPAIPRPLSPPDSPRSPTTMSPRSSRRLLPEPPAGLVLEPPASPRSPRALHASKSFGPAAGSSMSPRTPRSLSARLPTRGSLVRPEPMKPVNRSLFPSSTPSRSPMMVASGGPSSPAGTLRRSSKAISAPATPPAVTPRSGRGSNGKLHGGASSAPGSAPQPSPRKHFTDVEAEGIRDHHHTTESHSRRASAPMPGVVSASRQGAVSAGGLQTSSSIPSGLYTTTSSAGKNTDISLSDILGESLMSSLKLAKEKVKEKAKANEKPSQGLEEPAMAWLPTDLTTAGEKGVCPEADGGQQAMLDAQSAYDADKVSLLAAVDAECEKLAAGVRERLPGRSLSEVRNRFVSRVSSALRDSSVDMSYPFTSVVVKAAQAVAATREGARGDDKNPMVEAETANVQLRSALNDALAEYSREIANSFARDAEEIVSEYVEDAVPRLSRVLRISARTPTLPFPLPGFSTAEVASGLPLMSSAYPTLGDASVRPQLTCRTEEWKKKRLLRSTRKLRASRYSLDVVSLLSDWDEAVARSADRHTEECLGKLSAYASTVAEVACGRLREACRRYLRQRLRDLSSSFVKQLGAGASPGTLAANGASNGDVAQPKGDAAPLKSAEFASLGNGATVGNGAAHGNGAAAGMNNLKANGDAVGKETFSIHI